MSYINTGAYVGGKRPASKKALREALAAGADVMFDTTALYGGPGPIYPGSIPHGAKLAVAGPCPFTNRRWYATVTVTPAGVIKVI